MGAYTYPGVYIEEISSGQHTITGVATSIAAFVGWSNQGPVGTATMVESWSEYSQLFGGLIPGNLLGYAVYQFFGNGGSQAYIVRLVDSTAAVASSVIGGLQLYASNPGAWANGISVQIYNVTPNSTSTDLTFNLKVINSSTNQVLESYTNLSVLSTSSNFAVTTVNNDSNYLSFTAPGILTPPSFLPFYSVEGAVAAGSFDTGETVKQGGTGATAIFLGLTTGGDMLLGPIAGIADNSVWTGVTSAATFTATATPAVVVQAAGPTALNAGTGSVTGADGNVLVPNSGSFETALMVPATGFQVLANVPIFNILCVPGENSSSVVAGGTPSLLQFCHDNRAFLIIDAAQNVSKATLASNGPSDGGGNPYSSTLYPSYGGFYYPWISAADPQAGFRPTLFPPCGFVAGAFAATDANRGVWKSPAGIGANLSGAQGLQTVLNDADNGLLNPVAVNCLRQFRTYGNVIWGARTLDGGDAVGSQWKYTSLRRLANYIESSLYEGTQWVVFEPNDEPLWGQIRLSIGTFMQELFLRGAFAGSTPQQAYFVKCDSDNNPDFSVAQGIVNLTVGFKPLDPAEFVVIHITQIANS